MDGIKIVLKQNDEENNHSFLREMSETVSWGKVHTMYKYLTVKVDISFELFRMNCL